MIIGPVALAAASFFASLTNAQNYTATYDPTNLPNTTEGDQRGTNSCGTGNNQTALCQNAYINALDDFCVWGPPEPNSEIGVIEQYAVSYCSKPGRGTRLFPPGTLTSAHILVTPDYVQVTGTGDFTKINIRQGDAGGEMDPHGPDGFGNPHGGLVFSKIWGGGPEGQQLHEWTNFMSYNQFCIRACKPGPRAPQFCEHIYDVLGCAWNIPGQYGDGFTSCQGDDIIPMGLYPGPDGTTSTFHQGEPVTPPPHPAAPSSSCTTYTSAQLYAQTTAAPSTTAPAGSITAGPSNAGAAPSASGGTNRAVGAYSQISQVGWIVMFSVLAGGLMALA